MSTPVLVTDLPGLGPRHQGKVRDIYDAGDRLLLVATDRISAFDVVMADPIPDKGRILTQISAFWFRLLADVIPNHLISLKVEDFPPACQAYREVLAGRTMLVRKTQPLVVECIVRGYLAGSGWADYRKTGRVCGISLPPGLRESDRLPEPIFTPSTKAELGTHDENISFEEAAATIGAGLAARVREVSLTLYRRASAWAEPRGIILADTKFEFGLVNGELLLIDEVLTPDSSRFWPADKYAPGRDQESFDKQFVRNYLEDIHFNKSGPGVVLPPEVVQKTSAKYIEAYERLTGKRFVA
jgi:phosphoribosylaminoimidazole-succinocarboxamide synthase